MYRLETDCSLYLSILIGRCTFEHNSFWGQRHIIYNPSAKFHAAAKPRWKPQTLLSRASSWLNTMGTDASVCLQAQLHPLRAQRHLILYCLLKTRAQSLQIRPACCLMTWQNATITIFLQPVSLASSHLPWASFCNAWDYSGQSKSQFQQTCPKGSESLGPDNTLSCPDRQYT